MTPVPNHKPASDHATQRGILIVIVIACVLLGNVIHEWATGPEDWEIALESWSDFKTRAGMD